MHELPNKLKNMEENKPFGTCKVCGDLLLEGEVEFGICENCEDIIDIDEENEII